MLFGAVCMAGGREPYVMLEAYLIVVKRELSSRAWLQSLVTWMTVICLCLLGY